MAAPKKKIAKPEKVVEKPPTLLKEGTFTLVLSSEELVSAMQILSFSKELYEQMAVDTAKTGDTKGVLMWSARANLSTMLYAKLRDVASIGEPSSKELH